MALDVNLTIVNDVATIELSGDLDASTAPDFQEKIKEAASHNLKKLILQLAGLDYMASAGLRMLIFSKQQMGPDVNIYVVNAQEMVKDTIEKTGFHHSVIMVESDNIDDIADA
ncbi:MAG: anti-sigma factor antagonist [Synechocystis sp.]|nr:anti-sigma factor antagonist [Synechocystis sp.]